MFVNLNEWQRRLQTWLLTVADSHGRQVAECPMFMMPVSGISLYVRVQASGLVFYLSERGERKLYRLALPEKFSPVMIDHFVVDVRADPPTLGVAGCARAIGGLPFSPVEPCP